MRGETIMLIVPNADALMVEARVAPKDIDELHFDQAAVLRFSAFNLRTTPELNGNVAEIAADLTQDQRTGQSYYTVRIAIPPSELRTPRRPKAHSRHARRGLRPNGRQNGAELPNEAAL